MTERESSSSLYAFLRAFGWVVLALMLASVLYAGWISVANWTGIHV
jgi:hypothetical protein